MTTANIEPKALENKSGLTAMPVESPKVSRVRQVSLLGADLNPLTLEEFIVVLQDAVKGNRRWIVANHNLHSLYLFHHDASMRKFYSAAHCTIIDGMSIVLLARLFGLRLLRQHRLTALDWIYPVAELARNLDWRIFYLGAEPGVAETAAAVLRERYPGLQIKTEQGFFNQDSEENEEVLRQIGLYKPHVLMVGMGMPLQETWIIRNQSRIEANVVLNVGALFPYLAGDISTPPRWTGKVGIEWLFRLVTEPRRLWRRYILEPLYFLRLLLPGSGFAISQTTDSRCYDRQPDSQLK